MVATIIGGGIFALPIVFVHLWFIQGVFILLLTGILMLITGLILVDINMRFPDGSSFHTFTRELVGPGASLLVGIAFCFVLYSLTYAYMSGAISIIRDTMHIKSGNSVWVPITLLTLTTSGILFFGGRLPGYILSLLIIAKFTIFLMLFAGITEQVNPSMLKIVPSENSFHEYILIIPVCIIAFGFHGSIPSLTRMYSTVDHRAVTRSLFFGVIISFILYTFWLIITMGSMSPDKILEVSNKGGNIGEFIEALNINQPGHAIPVPLAYFGCVAVLASLMSASIGLCDYLNSCAE